MVNVTSLETAFGTLWLAAGERGLCRLALPSAKEHARFHQWVDKRFPSATRSFDYAQDRLPQSAIEEREPEILALAKRELSEYIAGSRRHFTVPLALDGSEFFRQVWDTLCAIPYGRTLTYATLATKLHRPRAFRAVGAACAMNPVPLIIPCHRAVGSNGSLTGFAGGLAMKESLLRMEGALEKKSRV